MTGLSERVDVGRQERHHSQMQLVERDTALTTLAGFVDDARADEGRTVLIGGEAGVGKTALLEALEEHVPDARWLWGACEGSFTSRPLGPVYDVAGQIGGELGQALDADASRQRIFRALLDDLTASPLLTILCIEDLHWADKATLDLLQFLAPRLKRAPALLLATYRNDGLTPDDPLRVTLGELGTQSTTRRLDLSPLSRPAVATLAQRHGIAADELFRLTGGNPFLVTEVIEAGTIGVPPSARDAVLARTARLSASARAALEAAAVIGNRVEVDLLRAVAACDADAIDRCLTAGAMMSDAGGFRFRHEIARRAVEEALPAHRRTELHQRVLDELRKRQSLDAARIAHHADGAGDAETVLEFAPLAAQQAASLGAHREAAAQYRRALRFADDVRTRARVLSALQAEYAFTDHWHDADDAQQEVLPLWQALDDKLRFGDILRQRSRTMWRLCRGDEAMQTAEQAVAVLEPLGPSVELAWAYTNFAALSNGAGRPRMDLLEQAQAMAEQFGEMGLLANIINSMACTKQGEEAVADFRRSLDIALAAEADAEVGRAFTNLQATYGNEYMLREAEQVFNEGMDYCEDHDIGTYAHCLRGAQGDVLMRLGRWDEADELLRFDLAERELSPVNKIGKLITKGTLEARRGLPSAAATLDDALVYAEAGVEPAYILMTGLARLEAAWLAGDAEEVRREAQRSIPHAGTVDGWARGTLAAWIRRCGLAEIDAGEVTRPYELELCGDWRAAADAWQALDAPYEQALALLDSGDAEAMQQAVRIFERLGATATVARAQAVMRQHGVASIPRGSRAETRANRFGLTRREQEVLALVCEGLTNADIGSRLFIAEKTVDNHVSSVLAKMNVDSRRDAARIAREAELATI
jgi:DNA-binding CsgD family transcriptional regulator/tetratricopeptide (TPR) repeat protein